MFRPRNSLFLTHSEHTLPSFTLQTRAFNSYLLDSQCLPLILARVNSPLLHSHSGSHVFACVLSHLRLVLLAFALCVSSPLHAQSKAEQKKLAAELKRVETLTDQKELSAIARDRAAAQDVRLAAIRKVEDQTLLVRLVEVDENAAIRLAALNTVTNQSKLSKIAMRPPVDPIIKFENSLAARRLNPHARHDYLRSLDKITMADLQGVDQEWRAKYVNSLRPNEDAVRFVLRTLDQKGLEELEKLARGGATGLAARIRLQRTTWAEVAETAKTDNALLDDALRAMIYGDVPAKELLALVNLVLARGRAGDFFDVGFVLDATDSRELAVAMFNSGQEQLRTRALRWARIQKISLTARAPQQITPVPAAPKAEAEKAFAAGLRYYIWSDTQEPYAGSNTSFSIAPIRLHVLSSPDVTTHIYRKRLTFVLKEDGKEIIETQTDEKSTSLTDPLLFILGDTKRKFVGKTLVELTLLGGAGEPDEAKILSNSVTVEVEFK